MTVLTSFIINNKNIREAVGTISPTKIGRIGVDIKVPLSGANKPITMGNAFQYLLQAELCRRAGGGIRGRQGRGYDSDAPEWFQDLDLDHVLNADSVMSLKRKMDERGQQFDWTDQIDLLKEAHERIENCIEGMDQWDYTEYTKRQLMASFPGDTLEEKKKWLKPDLPDEDKRKLAESCVHLAKMDGMQRIPLTQITHLVDREVDEDTITELVNLLDIVPYNQFIGPDRRIYPSYHLVNPLNRGIRSGEVDLISDSTLIDIKTVGEKGSYPKNYLNQLLGYFLMSRMHKEKVGGDEVTPNWSPITHVGIYFSRHGHLWTFNTEQWTSHKKFNDAEKLFWEEAETFDTKNYV